MTQNDNELRGIFKKGYGRICKYLMIYNKVSMPAKAVYAYLCSFAGAKDTTYPSREKICNDLGVSQNSLTKYILELVENNIITVSKNLNANNTYANNIYTISSDLEQRFKNLIEANSHHQNLVSENTKISYPKICVMDNLNNGNLMDGNLLSNNNKNNNNKTNNNKDFNNNSKTNNNKDSNNTRECENSLQTFQSILNNFSNNSSLVKTLTNFVSFREKLGKPFLTEESVEAFLETLNQISDDETKIECLNYSMSNNYTTIYPDFKDKPYNHKNKSSKKSNLPEEWMEFLCPEDLETYFKSSKEEQIIKRYDFLPQWLKRLPYEEVDKYYRCNKDEKKEMEDYYAPIVMQMSEEEIKAVNIHNMPSLSSLFNRNEINYDDPKDDEKYIHWANDDKDIELNFVHEWKPKEQVDMANMTEDELSDYIETLTW